MVDYTPEGLDKADQATADCEQSRSTCELLPLMRAMEKTRNAWELQYEQDGKVNKAALDEFFELRKKLVTSAATSPIDLLIQCATLYAVAMLAFDLAGTQPDTAEGVLRHRTFARETTAEVVAGLRAMQANLEGVTNMRASDLGLFSTFTHLN